MQLVSSFSTISLFFCYNNTDFNSHYCYLASGDGIILLPRNTETMLILQKVIGGGEQRIRWKC